ncbi:hypothetical protein [Chryseobacterium luquanense]|uniref:Lipoprotein n=1 Tax=Chryseobacterium luquanense TaxID=2983766 RepID=A0ABT3Y1P8_9FLAO|nr:hypothetical protein [Chryseobacterium luquanense]MCX8532055.1 hypothetical protein [Chryseobacterium luquanense]
MRKNFYLIIVSLCLVSCYTYQVKKPADPTATDNKQDSKRSAELAKASQGEMDSEKAESQKSNSQVIPAPINVQEKLAPNKNFKIDVDGKSYKIIVDRWESDSLVAHSVRNPKVIFKFHKNQINSEKIAEKQFSKPIADIITIAAYAGIGVGIWSLLK